MLKKNADIYTHVKKANKYLDNILVFNCFVGFLRKRSKIKIMKFRLHTC